MYIESAPLVSGSIGPLTDTTETELLPAPGAGLRYHITQLTVCNGDAVTGTVLELDIGGSQKYRLPAGASFGGAAPTFPAPLQCGVNSAITAKCLTAGAQVYVSVAGYCRGKGD